MDSRNINFVLVETSHPGNVGAVARAMKNMGLSQLSLVNPCAYQNDDCYSRAAGAQDLIDAAQVYTDLTTAVAESSLVVGTSARMRSVAWPQLSPRQAAEQIETHASVGQVSVVFGRERSGLTNEELALCSALVNIPTVADFSSLNVAAAVQVLAYEVYIAGSSGDAEPQGPVSGDQRTAPQADLERFYEHFFTVLERVGYHDPANPRQLSLRMRRLFNRASPRRSELQVLRGFLAAVEKHLPDRKN